jgi:hypothetical protein
MEPTTGSCLCGAVTYVLHGPESAFRYCHCPRCRKATGSAHAVNLFVAAGQFRWTSGEDNLKTYRLAEADSFTTCFCSICGSLMPRVLGDGRRVMVPAGTLDSDPEVRPTCGIWWSRRAPWYRGTHEIPQHEEGPV